MHFPQLLEQFEPETDPMRRHWQIMLAMAWALCPRATVDEAVHNAITFGGRGIEVDRRLVEAVALDTLLARGPEVTA